jgi:hypothetical protein
LFDRVIHGCGDSACDDHALACASLQRHNRRANVPFKPWIQAILNPRR